MFDYAKIPSPILLRGDDKTAYRDPAAYYDGRRFYLFCTYVECDDGGPYLYTVESVSEDLINWSAPIKLTPKNKALNFSSPGNVVRADDGYRLCLQTYCRENGEKFGNENSRIWTMRSDDLIVWDAPRLLRAKGDTPREDMGRMIDPFLLRDKDDPRKWWCLYKQNGVSMSLSPDLENWTYQGHTNAGENVCVIVKDNTYYVFHSPHNGIGILRTNDFVNFEVFGPLITLGQEQWPWARGRITAGFVLDLTKDPQYGKYLLFFHGSGPEGENTMFDHNASIGIAWSDNLLKWEYPNG